MITRMSLLSVQFVVGLTLVLAQSASSAIITSSDAAWPVAPNVQTVDTLGTVAQAARAGYFLNAGRWIAQSFQVDEGFTVKEIVLSARNFYGTEDFDISFHEVENVGAAALTLGSQIGDTIRVDAPGAAYTTFAGTGTQTDTNLAISLAGSEHVFLPQRNAGTQGYVMRLDDVTGNVVFGWLHPNDTTDYYADGRYFRNDTFVPTASMDMGLALSIPEPASAALLGLFGVIVLWRRLACSMHHRS